MLSVKLTGHTVAYDPGITSTLELTGAEGTQITGYYTRNGERIAVSGTLPKTITDTGIGRCEFRKVNVEETLELKASDSRSFMNPIANAGTLGVWVDMHKRQTGSLRE